MKSVNVGGIRARIGAHHPWNALIHHTLQPVAGVYPTYYNLLHTKQDMSTEAAYKGDVGATYAAHHLFSGAAPLPIGPRDKEGHEMRIKRGRPRGKKNVSKKEEAQIKSGLPNGIPPRPPLKKLDLLGKALPKLVPIECGASPRSDSDSEGEGYGTRAQIKSRLPELVPIECGASPRSPKSDSDSEGEGYGTRAQIKSRLPELVPIHSDANDVKNKMRARLVPIEKHHGSHHGHRHLHETKKTKDDDEDAYMIRSKLPTLIPIEGHHHGHGRHHKSKTWGKDDMDEYGYMGSKLPTLVPISSAAEDTDEIDESIRGMDSALTANNYGLPSIHDVFDF